ncbi:hypothetical protein BASA82_001152 [Batrachochytrium salamandrivorans]|uniref:Multifunctional methyltransferase subunit TRM112 n=1 Tax=Batrachochytrium salamandrivorans TaxID=1357716 RepID=A0ABQ8F647_9FUNG|nr:hypothetical protein BASA62_004436 [Batrachochytrium salamandrivorans]KAH6584592.1 hypothetical protein BASA60_000911 [Batrachochytrium salamandrivorans]KAH6592663.1 hypothetical protein BASA50_007951 [Batrachochytrium salamandrivorans]KAH6602777.1 hypothetical protein BASA61_000763 [Batrachochytrium salamandrivorans]KAH9256868.1 hypothetical protein BASA81_004981 [Batrachochytrium salamandrivorans]
MRLITHNMLQCHAKGCNTDNFPLQIKDAEIESIEADFNIGFIQRLIPKLHWPAFVHTALSLGIDTLPETLPVEPSEDILLAIHKVALETRIKEGKIVCLGCSHEYIISNGIPNMLLQDNEV